MAHLTDSLAIFKNYSWAWKALGINASGNKYLLGAYDLMLTVLITICFPLHLIIGLLRSETQEAIFSNLGINIACLTCSIKQFSYRRKLHRMQEIEAIFNELDGNVHHWEERHYFQHAVIPNAKRILRIYNVFYFGIAFSALPPLLMGGERRLQYPAAFPFDWNASTFNYACAITYQFAGLIIQIIQNLAHDSYVPIGFLVCAAHVHMLGIRVAKIGFDKQQATEQNYKDLTECIKDYRKLMNIYKLLQETISASVFTQFMGTSSIVCVAMVYILFFTDQLFLYIYYFIFIIAASLQLFPCCYYGSIMELEFYEFSYSIFSSNWFTQNRSFRQSLVVFTEMTLSKVSVYAGGMVRIHLDSFFATCKMAYSLFTVVQNMK